VRRVALLLLIAAATLAARPVLGAAAGPTAAIASQIHGLIKAISLEAGVEERLVHAVVSVESAYNPHAVSRKGALGLMQLMPATARRLQVTDPFDPEQNLRGGVRELARLIERFAGDLVLALAAYNAGETAVARYGGVPPYRETRSYVSQVMSLYTGRSFHLPGRSVRAPVRLLRQGRDGRIVMTNLPPGAQTLRPGISISGSSGASSSQPMLSGGFGGTTR